MQHLQNLHTHTTLCDGAHTPEEMVRFAMDKGFESLGFSAHAYMFYSPYRLLTPESNKQYKTAINALKKQYQGVFPIYLGLELDIYSDVDQTGYDYMLGAVHYLKIGEEYVGIDRPAEAVQAVIDTCFGGNGLACAKAYYETVAQLPQYGTFEILAHLDLIAKNIEKAPLFDVQSREYLGYAVEAIEAVRGKIPFFEVNTGSLARGYRSTPYPSVELVKELRERGFGAIISSDCHDGHQLDCGFEEARELLAACGFTERYILTDNGFAAVAL